MQLLLVWFSTLPPWLCCPQRCLLESFLFLHRNLTPFHMNLSFFLIFRQVHSMPTQTRPGFMHGHHRSVRYLNRGFDKLFSEDNPSPRRPPGFEQHVTLKSNCRIRGLNFGHIGRSAIVSWMTGVRQSTDLGPNSVPNDGFPFLQTRTTDPKQKLIAQRNSHE